MKHIDNIGRTAFLIAQWRKEETERINPLFLDHIANIFLSSEAKKMATSITGISPSTRLLVTYRTKFFDEDMIRYVNNGVEQVVILGAGLDTRSLRLATAAVKVFEVDKEEVLNFKFETLKHYGYHSDSIYVPCDYTSASFIEQLIQHGFDTSLYTYLIWEGNTMYLSKNDIISVLWHCEKNMTHFVISFDYLSEKLVLQKTHMKSSDGLVQYFDSLGAEWKTGFDNIEIIANQMDLVLLKNFLIADFIAQNDSRYKSASSILNDYSICSLTQVNK